MKLQYSTVGSYKDFVHVPYISGMNSVYAHLNTLYYHAHGASFVYPDKANPITLTSSAGVWTSTGAKVEVIPANVITKIFDLHWISVTDISAGLYGVVDIFSGAIGEEVKIGAIDISRTSNFTQEGQKRIMVPQQPANTRISCGFSDSTSSAQTVGVKFNGHVYGTTL